MGIEDEESKLEQQLKEIIEKLPVRKRLVFDKESKRIVTKEWEEDEEEADNINFNPEEARHYGGISTEDVFSLLQIVCSALGGAKIVIELAKLWAEDRKSRKVILKKGDVEIEIQGGVSVSEINERIELFKKLSKDTQADEMKIIVP